MTRSIAFWILFDFAMICVASVCMGVAIAVGDWPTVLIIVTFLLTTARCLSYQREILQLQREISHLTFSRSTFVAFLQEQLDGAGPEPEKQPEAQQ